MVHVKDCWLNASFNICNVYGTYTNRCFIWDLLSNSNVLKCSNLILGGDLNFILSLAEVWGQNLRQDPFESYFHQWMEKHGVFDKDPKKISYTWSNGRKGLGLVEKHIDFFFYL
jgi:hypothetical protein